MRPGRLLGYCAMHLKIKRIHGLSVQRDHLYAATKRKNKKRGSDLRFFSEPLSLVCHSEIFCPRISFFIHVS